MRDELDKYSQNDRMLLVRNEDGIEHHPTIMVDRIFLESRRSVQAQLFLFAVEIAMKTLLVANKQNFLTYTALRKHGMKLASNSSKKLCIFFQNTISTKIPHQSLLLIW